MVHRAICCGKMGRDKAKASPNNSELDPYHGSLTSISQDLLNEHMMPDVDKDFVKYI
jgi:hypothetical protein